MKVTFLHPDLGIGGAERLIVDSALSLNLLSHKTNIFTSYHSKTHCFKETIDGSLKVQVVGDNLPSQIFNKGKAILAYLRQIIVIAYLLCKGWETDLFVVDQVSIGIPILKLFGFKVLFYCHYPDLLLTDRKSLLKRIYRYPIDSLEAWSIGQADTILVNSKFTLSVVKATFPNLNFDKLKVLYPGINTQLYKELKKDEVTESIQQLKGDKELIISINRFERKKNVNLAIQAFKKLEESMEKVKFNSLRLVIAGGYDPNNLENVQHLEELIALTTSFDLTTFTKTKNDSTAIPADTQVLFLPSFDEVQRSFLLNNSKVLVYTPQGEHFGIVPVEAMYSKLPVIALDSAGPKETVLDQETGFLVEPEAQAIAQKMELLVTDWDLNAKLGVQGRKRVEELFSLETFQKQLDQFAVQTATNNISSGVGEMILQFLFCFIANFLVAPFILWCVFFTKLQD